MPNKRPDYYMEGYDAALKGRKLLSNPYSALGHGGRPAWAAWRQGWKAADAFISESVEVAADIAKGVY